MKKSEMKRIYEELKREGYKNIKGPFFSQSKSKEFFTVKGSSETWFFYYREVKGKCFFDGSEPQK